MGMITEDNVFLIPFDYQELLFIMRDNTASLGGVS
jgi:hypothetical protein